MKKVYICSPLKGDIQGNIERARKYCREALLNDGCIPIAPHTYFTQFLDDTNAIERTIGMECGIELLDMCDELWVFGDTISEGMRAEIDYFEDHYNRQIVYKEPTIDNQPIVPKELQKDFITRMFKEVMGKDVTFVDVTDKK